MFGNQLIDMIFAPWATGALYCANRLKIFTCLAERPMTTRELSEKIGAVPYALGTLLDTCTALNLLKKKNNRYSNSYISNIYLVEGTPMYLGDIIEVISIESGRWDDLYDLVMNHKVKAPGEPAKKIESQRFTMAMNNLAMIGEAQALANATDLSNAQKMIDAGCGPGIYSVTLCRLYPNLQATLLDREEVLETTKKIVEKSNLRDRIKIRAADITTDSYGQQSDVVLLSDVLYHEKSICLKILRNAYKALKPGGTLLVRGYYADTDESGSNSLFGSLFNLHQLFDDPERKIISVSLLNQWIEQVGFKQIVTSPLTERSHCFTAKR